MSLLRFYTIITLTCIFKYLKLKKLYTVKYEKKDYKPFILGD